MKYLENKTCIVTGASSGLGRCLSYILIKKYGCRVIGIARNREHLEALAESLESDSKLFEYRVCDLTDSSAVKAVAEELAEINTPLVLINNAGIMPPFGNFLRRPPTETERVITTNLLAPLKLIEALYPRITQLGGGIVNIASSDALAPLAGTGVYALTKSAIKGFTEALSAEAAKNVYIGLVCPGFNRTSLFSGNNMAGKSGSILRLAADPQKTALKIANGINRRKKRMVLGFDAKIMDVMYRLMPVKSTRIFAAILRKCGYEMFSDVF